MPLAAWSANAAEYHSANSLRLAGRAPTSILRMSPTWRSRAWDPRPAHAAVGRLLSKRTASKHRTATTTAPRRCCAIARARSRSRGGDGAGRASAQRSRPALATCDRGAGRGQPHARSAGAGASRKKSKNAAKTVHFNNLPSALAVPPDGATIAPVRSRRRSCSRPKVRIRTAGLAAISCLSGSSRSRGRRRLVLAPGVPRGAR